jgi:hypothetical protein
MPATLRIRSVSRRRVLAGAGALGLTVAARGLLASAQEASPEATPYPLANHPLIGARQWTNLSATPPDNIDYAVVNVDGTYVEYNSFTGVGMGL